MKIRYLLIGFAVGMLLTAVVGWLTMPGLMLKEHRSPYGVEETVEKIRQNALAQGWVISGITPLDVSVSRHGGGNLPPVRLINLCEPHHAFNILREDDNKIVSVMMPCTISVYQKADGNTYVGTMNASLLGKMFGGTIAKVMGGTVAEQQLTFINFVEPQ